MNISVSEITQSKDPDFPYIHTFVTFNEHNETPKFSVEVTLYLDKKDMTLSDIESLALEKAYKILQQMLSSRVS